jgi:prepilin signal peptidase PulO-like enzyme (type II secretory pathway)
VFIRSQVLSILLFDWKAYVEPDFICLEIISFVLFIMVMSTKVLWVKLGSLAS